MAVMQTHAVPPPGEIDVAPGVRFGRLVVVRHVRGQRWAAQCDCGRETEVARTYLLAGKVRSCGCMLPGGNARKPRRDLLPVEPIMPLLESYHDQQEYPAMAAGSWRALSQQTGISERAFNRWQRGECTTITITNARRLADALGQSALAIWGLANRPDDDRAPDPELDLAATGAERLFRELVRRGLSSEAVRAAALLCVELDTPGNSPCLAA